MKTLKNITRLVIAGVLMMQVALATAQDHSKTVLKNDDGIRPFKVRFSDAAIKGLQQRVAATKWPGKELVGDASQGAKLVKMQELAKYWGTSYDWRKAEARLNTYPQFKTQIDGVDIHFIHVKSKHQNAMPLILSHGWPGSVFEFISVIEPLTNPTAFGGKAEDAFDVIIPSLPGFGFSGKPTVEGWNNERIAKAWIVLMDRLGYKRYVAQGGDWGAAIAHEMALKSPKGLLGIHSNLPATLPNEAAMALGGNIVPAGFSEKESAAFLQLNNAIKTGGFIYKTTLEAKPQGLSYGLSDSPVGLASWIFLHPGFDDWSYGQDSKQLPTKDQVLDDISLYWLTNTASSSAQIYWENRKNSIISADLMKSDQITIPVAVTTFPKDVYASPESWARKAYKNLSYFNEVDRGGHFAAWEEPQLFIQEMRAAFKTLR
ncbi:epoxide hydrolase family protein [Pedobacter rhizosphaerae]|uniref:Pimeloyl-ACP methyl ester carboxylesterase n=1 Tax=Pedobacter rhizosphaerae TaxID=390241 RepID=A0A1H9P6Z4_9SPHI|nr:epoxide hydrolase family protein [Pedobacter rhizosphaerae]SER43851.1 Pimeloyl-ACP methyl ester carboxylesterase [Pedobacter rhizosphaerae]